MKKILKKIPFPLLPVLFGCAIALLGLVLMIAPQTSLNTVCFAGGIVVLLKALSKLSDCIKGFENGTPTTDIISLVATTCVGIVLMVHPKPLLSLFPIFVGICTLIFGIVSFFTRGRRSLIGKITSAITIILAIVVINSPMVFAEAATSISGIALFVIGVVLVASKFYAEKKLKEWNIEISTEPDDGYKEVEFTDVDE
ncbi:MAG: DUF308 domain-containing protein [Clostridia bacterium]|nr:DUF308 domain-containing protein [Clostridia bacterium]